MSCKNENCKCANKKCKNKVQGLIGLIDGDSLPYAYAWLFRDKDPTNSDHVLEMKSALRNGVDSTLRETKCTHFIGLLAGSKRCFRYDVFSDYKGQRSKGDSYREWGDTIKEALIEMGFVTMGESPLEVDDAVGILNQYYTDRNWSVIIIAVDKDILQLPGKHYNPVKKKWTTVLGLGDFTKVKIKKKNVIEASGEFLLASQMLTGDSTDNIKGLKGRGPMFAYKCLDGSCSIYEMKMKVAREYVKEYSTTWKEEFRKTYSLVKILDHENFIEQYNMSIPIPMEVITKSKYESNDLELIDLVDNFLDTL